MTIKQLMLGGGVSTKAIGVDQFFSYLAGLQGGNDSPASMYSAVAWAYRCVNLRANAISSIPYRVMSGEQEVEWPYPLNRWLAATEMFICLFGAAYWLKRANRVALKDIQILNPQTMKVKTDASGITGFEQTVKGQKKLFKPEQIVYFRLLNPSDDLGPGIAPMKAALEAAGLAANVNEWAGKFFSQGAIPAVLLTTEQALPDGEQERLQKVWERWTKGIKNAWRTMVLHRGLRADVIGMPVKDLAMPELTKMVREEVAVSFGVPESMVGDPASNYATARTNRLSFWQDTIIPEGRMLEHFLNEQLFKPMELKFEFEFGRIEAIQQDEAEKAELVVKLYEAQIMTLAEAREQMNLPDVPMVSATNEQAAPTEIQPEQQEQIAAEKRLTALRKWRTKARKRGKPVDFESDYISEPMVDAVKSAMETVGVERAFDFLKSVPEGMSASEARLEKRVAAALSANMSPTVDAIESGNAVDWTNFSNDMQSAIQPELVNIAIEQALRNAEALGIDFDLAVINQAALEWASGYTYDLVKGLTETTREVVARATEAFINTPGMTTGDLTDLLTPAFGDVRAKMIAITEVTRAYSSATNIYQRMLKDYGLETVRMWRTSADERVCPICGPLDGAPETNWSDMFPGGPPAHVRCRCWTTLTVK